MSQAIGFLGGTFNPVHYGHLRAAVEFAEAFNLEKVALLPCYQPPHKVMPDVDAQKRLMMLQLAIEPCARLSVDSRELEKDSPSYTVESLSAIRQEVGDDCAVYFAMGIDAFETIEQWKNWQTLFELANIVVLTRPHYQLNPDNAVLKRYLKQDATQQQAFGACYLLEVTALGMSATQIRHLLKQKKTIHYLLPPAVEQFIQHQGLYLHD